MARASLAAKRALGLKLSIVCPLTGESCGGEIVLKPASLLFHPVTSDEKTEADIRAYSWNAENAVGNQFAEMIPDGSSPAQRENQASKGVSKLNLKEPSRKRSAGVGNGGEANDRAVQVAMDVKTRMENGTRVRKADEVMRGWISGSFSKGLSASGSR